MSDCSRFPGRITLPLCWTGWNGPFSTRSPSFAGAAVLGLVLALLRLSRHRALRIPAAVYTEVFKNIPLLAIIFVSYFGLASAGLKLDVFSAGCVSLIVFYAAYLSEIFRVRDRRRPRRSAGGVRGARPRPGQHFRVRRVPAGTALRAAGTNTMLVDLLKSTSLLVTISAAELMSEGRLITSATFRALEVYLVIAAIYFALCYPLSQGLLWLERKIRAGVPLTPKRRRRLKAAPWRCWRRSVGMTDVTGSVWNDAVVRIENLTKSFDGRLVLDGVA